MRVYIPSNDVGIPHPVYQPRPLPLPAPVPTTDIQAVDHGYRGLASGSDRHADRPAARRLRSHPTVAAQVEDLGVDIIFNWDHFLPISGDERGKHFEC